MAEHSPVDKLTSASAQGNLAEVNCLLQNGADVNGYNIYGRTALQVVKQGNPAVAEALLCWGANPNIHDPCCHLTITHDAARGGWTDTVRVLIDHGADVNLLDIHGNLPLHLAAREGHYEVVQLLMGRTADPASRNTQGHTPHDLALGYSNMNIANYIATYTGLQIE